MVIMMQSRSSRICICALFCAVGIILGYIESFIVLPVRIPGIRIGLANMVTLTLLYLMGPFHALIVLLLRVIMSAILFGSGISFVYSLCGALISYAGMLLLKKGGFSMPGVSAAGAVLHNAGQILAAYVLIGNVYVFSYLPILTLAGVIFGLFTGLLAAVVTVRLNNIINKERGNI